MYTVEISDRAMKSLNKMDKGVSKLLLRWIYKHLDGIQDPRMKGKPLSSNRKGSWRYRIGDYRILARIQDKQLLILVVDVGHRKAIYN